MNNWKDEAEKRFPSPYEREKQKAKLKEQRRLAQEQAQSRPIEENLKNFSCHICGITAKEPGTVSHTGSSGTGEGIEFYTVDSKTYLFPGDLSQCHYCSKWTCKEHIVYLDAKGLICQSCVKLPNALLTIMRIWGGWA